MTRDDDIERVLDQWFTEGPTQMPARFFNETFDRIDRAPKRNVWPGIPRLSRTHRITRLAAVAAVVAVVGLAGVFLAQQREVGVAASPTPSDTPPPSGAAGPLPAALQSGWTSDGLRPYPGAPVPSRYDIVLGPSSIKIPGVKADLLSAASFVEPEGLDLRVTAPADDAGKHGWQCSVGDAATYTFRLSSSDQVLTLTPVRDTCATRAAVLSGDWIRTDMGALEAGPHVTALFRPFDGADGQLSYVVPPGWEEGYECANCVWLLKQGNTVNSMIQLYSSVEPRSNDESCPEAAPATANGRTPEAIASWLTTFPGLVVTAPTPVTVGGLTGLMVDVSVVPGWTNTCSYSQSQDGPDGSISPPLYDSPVSTFFNPVDIGGYDVVLSLTGKARYLLLDRGDGATLLVSIETEDSAWDAFVADAMPIVESFQFTAGSRP